MRRCAENKERWHLPGCPDWWARLTDQLAKWQHGQVEDGTLCRPIRSMDRLCRCPRSPTTQIPVAVPAGPLGPLGLGYNDNIANGSMCSYLFLWLCLSSLGSLSTAARSGYNNATSIKAGRGNLELSSRAVCARSINGKRGCGPRHPSQPQTQPQPQPLPQPRKPSPKRAAAEAVNLRSFLACDFDFAAAAIIERCWPLTWPLLYPIPIQIPNSIPIESPAPGRIWGRLIPRRQRR